MNQQGNQAGEGAGYPGLTEILLAAAKVFWSGIKYIIPLCLLVYVPVNIIELFIPESYSVMSLLQDPMSMLDSGMYNDMLVYAHMSQVIRIVFTCIITGGFTYIAASRLPSTPTAVSSSGLLDYSLGKWFKLAFTGLLAYLIVNVSAFLIVPALYFSVIFIFHLNVSAISGEKGLKALIGSARMVKGRFIRSLLYTAAFSFIQIGLSSLITYLVSMVWPDYALFSPAEFTLTGKIAYILINALTETVCSFTVMAQAAWFVMLLKRIRDNSSQTIKA